MDCVPILYLDANIIMTEVLIRLANWEGRKKLNN